MTGKKRISSGKSAMSKTELLRLWQDEKGQDLTEYALLLVLISTVALAALRVIGQVVSNVFSNSAQNLAAS
jgi:Flp pilus assembly pilin Flp